MDLIEADRDYEKEIENFAKETVKEVESKSKMTGITVNNIANVISVGNSIEEEIESLNVKIEEIRPKDIDFTTHHGLFANPINRYFKKIKEEEKYIAILIDNLKSEKEILSRDNITLEIEINKLKDLVRKINSEYELGEKLRLEIINIAESNNENSQFKNILECLDRKMYDLKQMALIKEQSALAFEIIRNNNKAIIRNLDRVTNVTVEALNVAVAVANSLYNQKLVLDKIKKIETNTSNILLSTTGVLKNQTVNIAENNLSEVALENAFTNTLKVLNSVNEENKKYVPESQDKISELKKIGEESYG